MKEKESVEGIAVTKAEEMLMSATSISTTQIPTQNRTHGPTATQIRAAQAALNQAVIPLAEQLQITLSSSIHEAIRALQSKTWSGLTHRMSILAHRVALLVRRG